MVLCGVIAYVLALLYLQHTSQPSLKCARRAVEIDARQFEGHYRSPVNAASGDQGTTVPEPTLVDSGSAYRIPALLRLPVAIGEQRLDRIVLPAGCRIVALVRGGEVYMAKDCPIAETGDELLAVALVPRKAPLLEAVLKESFGPRRQWV
ncbi:MAG: hypothetical protein H7Y22_03980 [Gemmatimonadaceae bacterium]|nr:hypothetical protein [Gloeobacterales cyanobacterium ES-bin-141]